MKSRVTRYPLALALAEGMIVGGRYPYLARLLSLIKRMEIRNILRPQTRILNRMHHQVLKFLFAKGR